MKFRAILSYSLSTQRPEPGMDVPYKEYRRKCRLVGRIPVAENLYPCYEYEKRSQEFVVEAASAGEAAKKVLSQKDVVKIFGKKAEFGSTTVSGGYTNYTVLSGNECLGAVYDSGDVRRGGSLSVSKLQPQGKNETVFID